ncbi:MAG: phosphatase PAP2 family protein [Vicinamibacterales bacterium]|jgi:membrane-associated phospholipid phosphatase|nr:phosphatase PAP2 family protein [Vicinamibacterales bacterium]
MLHRTVLSAVLLAVVWAVPAAHAGQDPLPAARPAPSAAADAVRDDGRRTMGRFFPNLFRGTIGIASTDNIKPLLVGGGATGIGALFDDEVADWIADPDHGFGTTLEDGAAPAVVGAAVAVVFATGRAADGPRYRAMTYDLMHAFLINAGYSTLLKEVVQRERPNGEDDLSFPSGHASNAFTLAAVAERHYGWKAGLPAYTLASLVAVSRLQRNKHYLSDVMAGATLGYIIGRTVVRVNGQPLLSPRGPQLSLSPVISKRTRGLVAQVEF